MDTKYYICNYCYQEYIPKRRHHQKYCSNSCRSKAYHIRQRNNNNNNNNEPATATDAGDVTKDLVKAQENSITQKDTKPNKTEAISAAGVGNAAIGALTADIFKAIVINKEDRPVTLKDIKALLGAKKRYYKVNNLPMRLDNTHPIFDTETGEVLYVSLFESLQLLNS
ncbi:hypothetical protein DFQ05_1852 [Winogradskyella wandonensis]|uniref:Uncharacterized protein n=1 Tax=Winogradskyella wandonensis TaxID=1442586 RepID=A0A4R1KU47_9FLAO|nr:hypothetical protein [Winogradskyella wandonensis]TCK68067.1 hypothetical protein DFQ05_1852 [Winogradskyella wandonensis]